MATNMTGLRTHLMHLGCKTHSLLVRGRAHTCLYVAVQTHIHMHVAVFASLSIHC